MQSTIHEATLENGLRVVVRPSDSPVAAVYLWIDAGAVDELPGEEGAAHFLEHMVFKGTPSRGVGVAAATIEGLGGDLNAFTSHDETVVHATVEAGAWAEALDVVADMVRNAALDPDETRKEAQVILEEIRGYADDPDTVLEEATLARIFPNHPYGRPILGTLSSVGGMTPDALARFRARQHGADRAILAVAGGVDPDAVVAEARRRLGDWGRVGSPRPMPAISDTTGGPAVERVPASFDTAAVEIAFPTFGLGHPDAAAADILATAIGEGAASLLTTRLQFENNLATDVWATSSLRRGAGTLSFGFSPQDGRTADAVRHALDEIGAVVRRGLSASLLSRARDSLLADILFATETVDGRAYDLAFYLARFGDPRGREAWRRQILAVTADDVRRVAREWLRPERCQVSILDAGVKTAKLAAAVTQSLPSARASDHAPRRHVAKNGAVLWVLPDDTPLVAVQAIGVGGALLEQDRTAGTGAAWERMVVSGAGDLDATQLGEAIDDIAGTVEAFSGRSTFGVSATFPAAWLQDGLDLYGQVLTEPRFDADEWKRILDEMLEEVRTRGDRPEDLADELAWAAVYAGHPWRLPINGTASTLPAISARRLKQWHKQTVTAENTAVVITGGVDAGDAIEAMTPWLERLPVGTPDVARPAPARLVPGTTIGRAGKEQVHVGLYARGASHRDPLRQALRVTAALLDGQGGRLFLGLREARGLAYGVWAQSTSGEDGGMFAIGLSTDPARAEEARTALRHELTRLVDDPPGDEEVARYRRMLAGHAAMSLQRVTGRALDAASGERLGLPWGLDGHRKALATVDAAQVRDAIRRVLAGGVVEVVVSPDRAR